MAESEASAENEVHAADAAERLIHNLRASSRMLALAESCTAGLAADFLARVPGASRVLWGSFVCYTAGAKATMLGLDQERLKRYGLVSRETACDMALGALEKSGASLSAAVTGLAGPEGDGSAVAVGTVWIAVALRTGQDAGPLNETGASQTLAVREFHFQGSRNEVRLRAVAALLEQLLALCP
jgi:PncC family amidohydrolase